MTRRGEAPKPEKKRKTSMINLLGSGGSSSDLNSLAAPDKATMGRRKSGNSDDVVRLLLEVSGHGES